MALKVQNLVHWTWALGPGRCSLAAVKVSAQEEREENSAPDWHRIGTVEKEMKTKKEEKIRFRKIDKQINKYK